MTSLLRHMRDRRAGILLHPTSLPGMASNGDLGPDAFSFIDFLHDSGFSVWQTLPHGPTHADLSPYQCLSVHAGNPSWISLEPLVQRGWLEAQTESHDTGAASWRSDQLFQAHNVFLRQATKNERNAYHDFVQAQEHWLKDFALYTALREEQDGRSWVDWPPALRDREPSTLEQAHERLAAVIEHIQFQQFLFFEQWQALKHYANERGIALFGDMPLYVAHDSADVWVARDQFDLDEQGHAKSVAGVPPDYFSATGQRWGNPQYHWQHMQQNQFQWWRERLRTSLLLYDLVRIDHFRGLEAYWSIPVEAESAVEGEWVKAPGAALLQALQQEFGELPLVAEDLGVITPKVDALRQQYGLPGMKVLQFAFGSDATNPYLPHQHESNCAVYTGTHDNNTALGWFEALSEHEQAQCMDYLGHPQEPMPWPLIRAAFASVAKLAIIPLQDVLALGAEHRMNTPSTSEGNWRWRFEWDQIPAELSGRLRHLINLYNRKPEKKEKIQEKS